MRIVPFITQRAMIDRIVDHVRRPRPHALRPGPHGHGIAPALPSHRDGPPTLRPHADLIEIPVPHLKSSHREHHMDQHV